MCYFFSIPTEQTAKRDETNTRTKKVDRNKSTTYRVSTAVWEGTNSLIDEIIPVMRLKLQPTKEQERKAENTHLDSKCGMAESCGPYLAALSYNSKSGMARSFMFLGTARTSVGEPVSFDRSIGEEERWRGKKHDRWGN